MVLKILKSNQAYNLILFPLIAALFWARNILTPGVYGFLPEETNTVLFRPIFLLVAENYMLQAILSLILVIFIGFIVYRLNSRYSFYRVRTLLPSSLFVILVGGVAPVHFLHPVYFAAIFFLFSIDRAFGAYENKQITSNCFDSGLLLGIGSLFYFNLAWFLPASLFGMRIIAREFSWRNLILHFFGFLIPWIFSFAFYFIFDKTQLLLTALNQNLFVFNYGLTRNFYLLIYSGFWGLMLLIAGFSIIRRIDEQKISIRKFYSFFILLTVFLVGILVLAPAASVEMLVLIAIPSSYLISYLLLSFKRRFWAELIFTLLAGLAIYLQLTDLFPLFLK